MKAKGTKYADGTVVIEGQEEAQDYVAFSQMPTKIMSHTELTPNEKMAFSLIYTFNHNHKKFFGSNEFIAASLNLSTGTAANILNSLIKKGWLVAEYKDKKKRNRKSIALSLKAVKELYGEVIHIAKKLDTRNNVSRYTEECNDDTRNNEHTRLSTKKVTRPKRINFSKKNSEPLKKKKTSRPSTKMYPDVSEVVSSNKNFLPPTP